MSVKKLTGRRNLLKDYLLLVMAILGVLLIYTIVNDSITALNSIHSGLSPELFNSRRYTPVLSEVGVPLFLIITGHVILLGRHMLRWRAVLLLLVTSLLVWLPYGLSICAYVGYDFIETISLSLVFAGATSLLILLPISATALSLYGNRNKPAKRARK